MAPASAPRADGRPSGAGLLRARRILIALNDANFLISHRLAIAEALLAEGAEVHVAAPSEPHAEASLVRRGMIFHPLAMSAHGQNPLAEMRAVRDFRRLFRRVQPDLVHLVTVKAVLYGGLAARWANVPAAVFAMSGLGYVFSGRDLRSSMLRVGLRPLYRRALGHPNARVIFQNDDDRQRVGTICPGLGDRMRMIRGSGVDLEAFAPGPEPEGPVTVVLPARPLTAKGIAEFAGAARMLKAGGVEARFALVGDAPATTPTRVPEGQLARWRDEGAIELWGHRDDMAGVLRQAHIVALPSYREGMPKALLEAAASGLPSVTSDCPGCRDAVIAGETGLLVPPRDAGALATALERLIGDPALRRRMGAAARAHAERHFSVETVVAAHLEIYRDLLGTSGAGSCAA